MASGFVFVYLGIAALLAPVVWLVWWGLESLSSRPAAAHPQARGPEPAKTVYATPHAVDVTLPRHGGVVTVYSASGKELSTCAGPNSGGSCSRPLADGTVPCAGCLLALPRPIRGSLDWQIPAGYQTCLLGSYGVFRQAGAAS
jgi:hypothetical protein